MKLTDLYPIDQLLSTCLNITHIALVYPADKLHSVFPNTETVPAKMEHTKEAIFTDLGLYHLYFLISDDDKCRNCIFEFKEYDIFPYITSHLEDNFIWIGNEHPFYQWTDKERKFGLRTQHFTLITGDYNSELWK